MFSWRNREDISIFRETNLSSGKWNFFSTNPAGRVASEGILLSIHLYGKTYIQFSAFACRLQTDRLSEQYRTSWTFLHILVEMFETKFVGI